MGTTQVSTYGWMDKENVEYTYSRILYSLKKEGNPSICGNMDTLGGHCAEWNMSHTEGQVLHDSTDMRNLK